MRHFFTKKSFFVLLCIAGLLFLGNTASAALKTQDPYTDKVDKLFKDLNKTESAGIAVMALKEGKVLLRRGYGMANLEHKVPITPQTVFDIASVSKQFTGLAISMLIEEGKISLQDDIRRYIPELPAFGQTITIEHLVHHTSGIRDWPGTLALAGWNFDDVISFDQILTMAFNQKELNFKPGSEFLYSNTGYNLLAELVQRVTGKFFRQWTEENIFGPLEMKDTHFHDDHTEVVPKRAYGYARDQEGKFHTVADNLTAFGSSSLFTTIDDLAKWVKNFDNPKVGKEGALDRMLQRVDPKKRRSYAYGLGLGQYRGLNTISHGGSWASFRTFLVYFPEQRFSVVTLLNYSPSNSSRDAYDIADIYLADILKPQPRSSSNKPEPNPVPVPAAVLDEYTGTYRLGNAWYVTISRDGDRLKTQATAEDAFPTTATSQTRFWVEAYRAPIVFKRDKEGKVSHFLYRGSTCPKLEDLPIPDPEQWAEFTGEYISDELGTSYTIALSDGKLMAKHRRHGTIGLTYAYKDDFRGGEWFMQALEFFRGQKGKVEGFMINQARNRNLRFQKK
ncbi:MAG: serine hydrolase [Candidatus Aminicenantes bacterium]|nr:serine hydrolase [Candidatus Aminicenantes bacterium]